MGRERRAIAARKLARAELELLAAASIALLVAVLIIRARGNMDRGRRLLRAEVLDMAGERDDLAAALREHEPEPTDADVVPIAKEPDTRPSA